MAPSRQEKQYHGDQSIQIIFLLIANQQKTNTTSDMDKDSRARELSLTRGLHTALKVKDSKTGKVILKDNVFEDAKLEEHINHIDHLQKKEESRLRWEKEFMKKRLLRRGKSNPELLTLPPIEVGGRLSCSPRISRSVKKRYINMEEFCSDDSSPERSLHCSLEEIQEKPRLSVVSTRSLHASHPQSATLPALLSPSLTRKDSMNDPRFRKLLQNLVPKTELKKTMSSEI